MGEYSVSAATRNAIYRASRTLFYMKGIDDTSCRDIGYAANVNKSLISYHFKSKNAIAELVLRDFVKSMVDAVEERWGTDVSEHAVRDTLVELMMFRLLSTNHSICRFYYEIQSEAFTFEDSTFEIQINVMREYAADCGVEISESQLNTVTAMVQGTERELVRLVFCGLLNESIEDMVRRDVSCCFFLIGAESDQVQRWIDDAFRLAEGLTMVCDDTFTCRIVNV